MTADAFVELKNVTHNDFVIADRFVLPDNVP